MTNSGLYDAIHPAFRFEQTILIPSVLGGCHDLLNYPNELRLCSHARVYHCSQSGSSRLPPCATEDVS
jgi:hypothetical protein